MFEQKPLGFTVNVTYSLVQKSVCKLSQIFHFCVFNYPFIFSFVGIKQCIQVVFRCFYIFLKTLIKPSFP